MRGIWCSIAVFASLGMGDFALGRGLEPLMVDGMGEGYCGACDPCCSGRQCHHCRCCAYRNQQLGFNCGCNGSYKFPVPPLYTYHWPGMYSAQLMTDYHSPWRFPPLKPYVDEVPPEVLGTTSSLRRVQSASAVAGTARPSQSGSFSDHVERSLR